MSEEWRVHYELSGLKTTSATRCKTKAEAIEHGNGLERNNGYTVISIECDEQEIPWEVARKPVGAAE